MEKELDRIIEGIEIGLGIDDCSWSSIESAVRVLKVIKGLQSNVVGISDDEFEAMILEAIKG